MRSSFRETLVSKSWKVWRSNESPAALLVKRVLYASTLLNPTCVDPDRRTQNVCLFCYDASRGGRACFFAQIKLLLWTGSSRHLHETSALRSLMQKEFVRTCCDQDSKVVIDDNFKSACPQIKLESPGQCGHASSFPVEEHVDHPPMHGYTLLVRL